MITRRHFLTSIITVMLFAMVGRASAQGDVIFFRSGFNGVTQGMLEGESLDPTVTQGFRFAPSDNSQALKVEAGKTIGDELGDAFPSKAGAVVVVESGSARTVSYY
mgnify:CR=1 FL=1